LTEWSEEANHALELITYFFEFLVS